MARPFALMALLVLTVSLLLSYRGTVVCDDHLALEDCQERDEYYWLRHICKSSCETAGDCSGAERCVCDGRCGPSCVDVGQAPSCPPPPDHPSNGISWLTLPEGSTTPGGFGTTVNFHCNTGYLLVGHAETTCMSNGRWAEDPPSCVDPNWQADCADPEALVDGTFEVFDGPAGLIGARYKCREGFSVIGQRQNVTCIPSLGWEQVEIECVRKTCGSPGAPTSGFITSLDFRYGSTVTYRCHKSYLLTGSATRTCLPDGTWDNAVPTCEAQRCPAPTFTDGTVSLSSDNLLIGTRASFQCPVGYSLRGSDSAECLDDLTWSSPPPDCEMVTCTRPSLLTSGLAITTPGAMFNYDQSIRYRCIRRRERLHGDETRVCDEEGQWTGQEPSCHEICSSLPNRIPGGDSFNSPSAALYNWNGGQKIYFCNEFSRMYGISNFFCRDGEWSSDDLPHCVEEHDGDVQSFPIRSMTHAIVNGVLTVKQREALVIVDCRVSTFYGIPEWEKDLSRPSGTQYALRQDHRGDRWYRLRLTDIAQSDAGNYQCTTVDRLSSSRLQIEVIPTCVDPGYQEGRRTNRDTTGGVPAGRRGFVRFTCDPGYQMVGGYDQIGCDINGNWNHDPPDCVKPDCQGASLPDPAHGYSDTVFLPDGSATQTFQCLMGYYMLDGVEPVASLTLSCQEGVWDQTAPTCFPHTNMIIITTNSSMQRRDITAFAGDVVEIRCSQSGVQSLPRWSKITDGEAEDLAGEDDGANVVLRYPAVSLENAGTYVCNSPIDSYGEIVSLTIIARCPNPPAVPDGFIAPSSVKAAYYETDSITFLCNDGYLLHGDSQSQCLPDGWDTAFPECVPDVDLSLYMGGQFLATDSEVVRVAGDTVFFDCIDTASPHNIAEQALAGVVGWYKTAPDGERIGMAVHQRLVEDGNWRVLRLVLTDLTPDFTGLYVCGTVAETVTVRLLVTVPCRMPASPANGNVVLSAGTSYLSTASYDCDELYELAGEDERQCQASGQWSGVAPTCTIAYCPALTFSGVIIPPDVVGQAVAIGTTINFRCADIMVLSGPREMTCMDDGTWFPQQDTPECTDPCLNFECRLGWRCTLVGGGPACSSCLTEEDCAPSDENDGPVCGTDARDYPNACVLGVTACQSDNLSLQKAFDGTCSQGNLCFLRPTVIERGSPPCTNSRALFYYDADPGVVGCRSTESNECLPDGGFESMADCEDNCSRNYCNDPPGERGPCNLNQEYWTYDSITKHCETFSYGGCGDNRGTRGNQNRFQTLNDCIRSCHLGEVCPPCPATMTLSNACFYGKHALIVTITNIERFVTRGFIRFTVDVHAVLTPNRPGDVNFNPGPGQRVYCEDIFIDRPCSCPRLLPLVDQAYLFVSSTYRGQYLKLDGHGFVAEWTPELEAELTTTESCSSWASNLNAVL